MPTMTYENTAFCPLCKEPLEIVERIDARDIGGVLVCRCPECGHICQFSEDVLKGSAKRCTQRLRENTPNNSKESAYDDRL